MERDDVFQDTPSGRNPLALDPETLLNDQFRVGRVLGVGGFGITYLAFDEVLEMVVAVKEYLPSSIAVRKGTNTIQPLSSSGEKEDFEFGLRRFLQEARTLAKFEAHPNIVRVRTFFRENGTGYLVMNFYEGRTLSEYLAARNGFLPEDEALLIIEQVVEGLTAVHGEDILHRDIDPTNVYLADNGTVVLLDFGAARAAVGERTQSMSVVLKRGYAPHEQYHSHGDQGPWTDVYACSATLYRALTGYKPPEAAARILEDDLAPPEELVPSLSAATNEAVLEGLSIRPGDRPQTMAEFAALLPEPSAEAEPGWIGERTTLEAPASRAEGPSAELRVSSSHACRLYVDGSRAAELAPNETYTLGLDPGSHRLRAVRTDQSTRGEATVTASGPTVAGEGQSSQMSLDALMWQEVVSTPADEPTVVRVDFEDIPAVPEEPAHAGLEDTILSADGKASRAGTTDPQDGGGSADGSARAAGTDRAPDAPPAHLKVRTDRAAHLFVDGEREHRLVPDETQRIALVPGEHRLRVEAVDGGTKARRTVAVDRGETRTLEVPLNGEEPPTPESGAGGPSRRAVGVGAGALLAVVLLGWWLLFDNSAPRPQADRVLTTSGDVVVDVTANDEDPDGESIRVTAAGPVPDSVAQVTRVDSARIRVQLAAGFAGTAEVPYEVTDVDGATAASHVTLRVPFDGTQRPVAPDIEQPQVVHVDSLGDDGDLDVLMAALGDRAVTWSENTLSDDDRFRPPMPIEATVDGVVDVATTDLTGNGRVDVLSASLEDDVVAWYENQGGGTFSEARPLDTEADGAVAVRAADLDRDGDADVVAGHLLDQTVTWYQNQGDGEFAAERVVADSVRGLETLNISDLDDDGVPDVLVVSYQDSTIARYEPTRQAGDSVRFVQRPPVGTNLREPIEVHTADVLGNGREDVLAGKAGEEPLVLYENRAEGANQPTFGNKRVLSTGLRTIEEIDTGDIDGDGDLDIFAASFESDRVVWFENLGDGTFGPAQPVAVGVPNVISLTVADVDRDGDVDVLAASQTGNTVGWYENHLVE